MTKDICKARGESSSAVYAPIYDAGKDVDYANISACPVMNKINSAAGDSILSLLGTVGYTDISGMTVTMVAKVGESEFRDIVEVIGEKQQSYIVRINGDDYAVRKSIVRFVRY